MAIGDAPTIKSSKELMQDIVLQEIGTMCPSLTNPAEFRTWDQDRKLKAYFNNFFTRFPSNTARNFWEHSALTRTNKQAAEDLRLDRTKKMEEFCRELFSFPERYDGEADRKTRGNSIKRWNETENQFLDNVEEAITASRVNREQLIRYITSIYNHMSRDAEIERELLLPVFIKLREMGYTYQDLTA